MGCHCGHPDCTDCYPSKKITFVCPECYAVVYETDRDKHVMWHSMLRNRLCG